MAASELARALENVNALCQAGRLAEAEALGRQILAHDRGMAGAWHRLGVIMLATGRWNEAHQFLQQAIVLAPSVAEYHSDLGALYRLAGHLEEACASFRRALELDAAWADALENLGEALTKLGRTEEAIAACRRAVALRPERAHAHNQLGLALATAGEREEAEACCRRALELDPRCAGAHNNLGSLALERRDFAEARAAFERALAVEPHFAQAHANRGAALLREGQARMETGAPGAPELMQEALAAFDRALALEPNYAEAHNHRGTAQAESFVLAQRAGSSEARQWLEQALGSFERAIALDPKEASAHSHRGAALVELARLDYARELPRAEGFLAEAMVSLERALALNPNSAEAYANRGAALLELGKLCRVLRRKSHPAGYCQVAESSFSRALKLRPGLTRASCGQAAVHLQDHRFEEGAACVRQALEQAPDSADAHAMLAHFLFFLGQWEEAWRAAEWRLRSSRVQTLHPHGLGESRPTWSGEPAPGETILVYAEQGLGDTIQFARYLPLIRERAVLQCQPGLERLLHASSRSPDHFDRQVPLLSLPLALGRYEPWSPAEPYLHAEPAARQRWRERLGPRQAPRIGLAWAGNPAHKEDYRRSIPLTTLAPLFEIPSVTWHRLQMDLARDHAEPSARHGLLDLTPHLTDWAETAALLAELDLIICVDTAIAHLAGALGRPTWLLLSNAPDWRWGHEKTTTPWYPTMRIFRQPEPGDWEGAIRAVADALSATVTSGSIAGHPR